MELDFSTLDYSFGGNIESIVINPKTNNLYFRTENTSEHNIYMINNENKVKLIRRSFSISKTFDFDSDGNLYFANIEEKLKKISIDGKEEDLSSTWGILRKNYGVTSNNIHIDRKRNILYISTYENKIYKFNLKR